LMVVVVTSYEDEIMRLEMNGVVRCLIWKMSPFTKQYVLHL
jgi:hypothetical protein